MEKLVEINSDEEIGLIADIHGNASYLKIVLKDLLDKGVNRFIFLGDMITDFQDTKEVLTIIKNIQAKYPTNIILGNRDIDMLEREKGNRDFWKTELQNGNLLLSYNDLTPDDLQWLKTIPESLILQFPNGEKAFLIHSAKLTEDQKRIVMDNDIKIIIAAHDHRAINKDDRQNNGFWYLNPGSVGLTEDGISFGGTYGILTCNSKDIDYQQLKFKADKRTILDLYENIYSNDELKKSYWPMILDLSIKTGRNMATIFFAEIRRLTGLYSENESEKIKNGFYMPLKLEEHLTSGFNLDISGNSLTGPKEYMIAWKHYLQKTDHTPAKFPSNMGILNDKETREEIYNIALNNTLYYSSVYEINGLDKSYIEEAQETHYKHR